MSARTRAACFGIALLLACTQAPATGNPSGTELLEQRCSVPRPMICTMDYNPVCGLRGDSWQTYSNACAACSDLEVVGYRAGDCGSP